jgi:hypothetical protein
VTPAHALQRVRKLLALAAQDSGATQEESRSAALAAAHLITQHRLLDRERHAVDLADVTRLALRVLELERLLREAAEVRGRDTMPSRRRA